MKPKPTPQERREKAKRIKEKLKIRVLNKKHKKQHQRSKLIKEADRIFSIYIRGRDAGKPCCTCGTPWQETFQCGHFMSRRHLNTKWMDINAHGQCWRCNMVLSGEQYKHARYIDSIYTSYEVNSKEFGTKSVSQGIHDLAMSTEKVTDSEILETIQHYYKLCFDLGLDYKPKKQFLDTSTI